MRGLMIIATFQAVIEILAKYKADLNKPLSVSKARATPLMLAAAQGSVQTCIALVEVFSFLIFIVSLLSCV